MSTYDIKDRDNKIQASNVPPNQFTSSYNMTKLEVFALAVLAISSFFFLSVDIYSRIEMRDLINDFSRITYLKRIITWSTQQNKDTYINISVDYQRESNNSTEKFVVCYYTVPKNWSTVMDPLRIDENICTHIIVGFASIQNCSVDIADDDKWVYEVVANLKNNNPNLKVMISVGGGNDELNSGFSYMVKNHMNRKKFIRSVLNLTKELNFDGLDLDWEFPAWPSERVKREKIHFAQLIQEIRKEFDRSSRILILSVAVGAPQAIIDQCYIVPSIAENVDFVNLMSYDYHFFERYYPVTNLNAPLYSNNIESGYLSKLNVNFSAHYWITKKMPKDKIVVGIPTFGHSYKLDNSLNHKLLAPAAGFGELGSKGFVSYPTVCQFLDSGATSVFENTSKVPYAYKDYEWISYDDHQSIYYKIKWILENNFKGAMVFSLNTDDWNDRCNRNQTFPLTRFITKLLKNGV